MLMDLRGYSRIVFCVLLLLSFTHVLADDGSGSVFVYAGAGLKGPMTQIGEIFEEKTGIVVEYTFAGSGTLMTQMELSQKGDVYIPGGHPDYAIAQNKSLVMDPEYIAYHVPVIGVQPGNPFEIESVKDFTREGLKLALGDVNATAIGRQGQKLFNKLGLADEIERNVILRSPTINEVVTAMKMKQADACLITMDQVKGIDIEQVMLPDEESIALVVPIGVTTFTTQEDIARKFVDFVSSDEGKDVFKKHGFPVYPDPLYGDFGL